MITLLTVDKDKNITVSKGDVLDVNFKLNGLTLSSDDTLYFSVKDNLKDAETKITHKVTDIDVNSNSFRVVIPTALMITLDVGQYFYDLVYVDSEGNKRTLIYPCRLTVKEVAHNDNFTS